MDQNVFSVGQIARSLDVPLYRVMYALRSRNIEPACKVGPTNVYDEAAKDRIALVLKETAAGRWGKEATGQAATEAAAVTAGA